MSLDSWADALERGLPGRVERAVPAAPFTTYRLGGPIAVLVRAGSVADLLAVASIGPLPPTMVVGRGSNLLVADSGYAGLVVMLEGAFAEVRVDGDDVSAGGAVSLPVLARRAASAGRSGIEFYVGIPGSVGGAVRMNAGGHGQETARVLQRAWIVDLAAGTEAREEARTAGELNFSYRHSNLPASAVVTRATFLTEPDDPDACAERLDGIVRWRREHQPGGANAGSVFRNPEGDSAGRLIEAAGAKGLRVGGAVVSEKHANFIQAEEGATAQNVADLVSEVQRRVRGAFAVNLEPEIRFIGFSGDDDGAGGAP